MKKTELFAAVKVAVDAAKTDGKEINKDLLAASLMGQGASLSMVARELPKALKANGIVIASSTGSEELKKVREAVKVYFKGTKAVGKKGDKDYVPATKPEIATYRDLREYAEDLEDSFNISVEGAIKVIKSHLKDAGLDVPQKAKLGAVKQAIIEYFAAQKHVTLEGLADYLIKNVEDMDKDKALHAARMDFTFAKMLRDGLSLKDVN